MKICTKCKVEKSLSEFNKRKAAKDGKRSYCKECQKVLMSNWRSKNKEHEKEYRNINHEHLLNKRRENNGWESQKYLLRNDKVQECTSCGKIKEWSEYHNWKNGYNGKARSCKDCANKKNTERRLRKGAEMRAKEANYRKENYEALKEYSKKWKAENRDQYNLTVRNNLNSRYKNDSLYNLESRLRARIGLAFRNQGWTKKNSVHRMLGCDFETVKQHLESLFTDGMSWDNKGEWHIDHILPLAMATEPFELEALCYYKNLQPLWATDNMKKSDSWE